MVALFLHESYCSLYVLASFLSWNLVVTPSVWLVRLLRKNLKGNGLSILMLLDLVISSFVIESFASRCGNRRGSPLGKECKLIPCSFCLLPQAIQLITHQINDWMIAIEYRKLMSQEQRSSLPTEEIQTTTTFVQLIKSIDLQEVKSTIIAGMWPVFSHGAKYLAPKTLAVRSVDMK